MLMKGVAANKTDEDKLEVRRSSRLAEKSPVSFENLFLPPETPLPFGQELSLDEIPETPGCQPFALHRDQAQCKEEDESLKKLNDFLGETISMPNVVCNMVAARIIKQYISYCKEIAFSHLSERELYRVLKYCPAQQ